METITATEKWSKIFLDNRVVNYILKAGTPVKTVEVAREVGEPLGASARLIRKELNDSPQLMLVDRRWDLRSRHPDKKRSVEGLLQWILREQGQPLSISQLAQELSLVRGRLREHYYQLVEQLVTTRPQYFVTTEGLCGLCEWLVDLSGEDEVTIRRRNFFLSPLDLETELQKMDLAAVSVRESPRAIALALLETAEVPVPNKVLGYATWLVWGQPFDSLELFESLLDDSGTELLPGPAWCSRSVVETLNVTLLDLSDRLAEAPFEVIDVEEALQMELTEAERTFELSANDLDEIVRLIEETQQPTPIATLISDVFELFPGDGPYVPGLQRLSEALQQDDRFVLMEENKWFLRSLLPPTLYRVPVTLQPSPIRVLTPIGEPVDAPLSDDGLEIGLLLHVHAADLEDIGEEQEVGEIRAGTKLLQKVRFVTNYRHYVSGTLKIRKIDRGVFPPEPNLLPVRLETVGSDETVDLWLNNETHLLCGLERWYRQHPELPPAGGVFFIEVTDTPGLWRGSIQAEPDPFLFIAPERLEELRALRAQLEHDPSVSVLDIMRQIMSHYPEGMSFRQLYAEANIVRRITKRIIASNLCAYPAFSQREDNEELWVVDPTRTDRARLSAKKQFILKEDLS